MKTAEEILNKNYYQKNDPEVDFDTLVHIINEARKEAIEECAKRVQIKIGWTENDYMIDKQSILSLINELK